MLTTKRCSSYPAVMNISDDVTYYEWLGVQPDDSRATVCSAFVRLAKPYHPATIDTTDSRAIFHSLCKAFGTLFSPDTRRDYDESAGISSHQDPEVGMQIQLPDMSCQTNTYCVTIDFDEHLFNNVFSVCKSYYNDVDPIDRDTNGVQFKTDYHSPGEGSVLGSISMTFYKSTRVLHVQGSSAFLWIAEILPLLYSRAEVDMLAQSFDESVVIENDHGRESSPSTESRRSLRNGTPAAMHGTPEAPASNMSNDEKKAPKQRGRPAKKIDRCKHEKCKGKPGDQIRCIICMGWFHYLCAGEKENYVGSWTCSNCRMLPFIVAQLQIQLTSFMSTNKNESELSNLKSENSAQAERIKKLESDKSNLSQKVNHLETVNQNMNKLIDTLSRPAPPATQTTPSYDSGPANENTEESHRREASSQSDDNEATHRREASSQSDDWVPGDGVTTNNRFSAFNPTPDPAPDSDTSGSEPDKIDVNVISSSMARGVAELLSKDKRFVTEGYIYPGESARQINGHIRNVPSSSVTVVQAGTIDADRSSAEECMEEVRKVMDNISRKRKAKTVIMCELPYRQKRKQYLNSKIDKINKYIHSISNMYENVHILEHDNAPGDFKDDIHFNEQGIGKFCLNIRHKLRAMNILQ